MSVIKSIERLSHILNFLNETSFPSKEKIISYLETKDLFPTERTFQRDLKTLREICFIELKYNRFYNGYFIDEENRPDFENWMQVFELFNTARIINDTIIKCAGNIDFIDFDRATMNMKPDTMGVLLKAVLEHKMIQFNHSSFWREEKRTMIIEPYLLKQYQNRWYIYGCFQDGQFRSFGIDRISELEVLNDSFKPRIKHPKEVFDKLIGLVYENEEVEEVILSFDPFQGKYIKSLPLHNSQKIIEDNEQELLISVRIIPNYELEEQILKHGERVKVIKPEWLRDSIRDRLKNALEKYLK